MLQEVCEYLHNYFIRTEPQSGEWTIADGAISPAPDLKEGQRFLLHGSDLNDGIYTWHQAGLKNDDDNTGAGLTDESFTGQICGLSIPPQVVALASEISEWVEQNGNVINSPYQSESFGGYSYSRAGGSGGSGLAGWREVFGSRLSRWKKVAF